jgi:hypothetical protein
VAAKHCHERASALALAGIVGGPDHVERGDRSAQLELERAGETIKLFERLELGTVVDAGAVGGAKLELDLVPEVSRQPRAIRRHVKHRVVAAQRWVRASGAWLTDGFRGGHIGG